MEKNDEESQIEIPEDFEVNLDGSEADNEEEEESASEGEEGSIEEIVSDAPSQNINFSSDFAPQQFVSSQPRAISPVLEAKEIPDTFQQQDLENEMQMPFVKGCLAGDVVCVAKSIEVFEEKMGVDVMEIQWD